MAEHENFMQMALAEAARGQGFVEPNPQVGAVIVRDGTVIAAGCHQRYGGPHAEVEAIRLAGTDAAGATLYVTLEPCSSHGKTPPCVDAIKDAGITQVVTATADPNPANRDRGHKQLQQAGITLVKGVLEEEARRLTAPYSKFITRSIPYVTAKWAMTLDGKIATTAGKSHWISCDQSRKHVHQLRGRMDGVLVGIGTALVDNPLLTPRHFGPRKPVRIVLDSRGRIPTDSRLLASLDKGTVLIATSSSAPRENLDRIRATGAQVLVTSSPTMVDLQELLTHLGTMKMTNLLVEGGGTILGAFFDEGLVDAVQVFVAPRIFGGTDAPGPVGGRGIDLVKKTLALRETTFDQIGDDVFITGITGADY